MHPHGAAANFNSTRFQMEPREAPDMHALEAYWARSTSISLPQCASAIVLGS